MKTKTTTLASLLAITLTAAGQTPAIGAIKADFNGDGFADLAIGSPFDDYIVLSGIGNATDCGLVTVHYGSSSGLDNSIRTTWHQNISGVADTCENGDLFGAALAAGDINRDGFSDLVIGIPGERDSSGNRGGAVQVLLGSSTGLKAGGNIIIHGSTYKHMFKSRSGALSLVCADFNGDGFADLVAETEVSTAQITEPRLFFIPGSATGLSAQNHQSIRLPADTRFDLPETTSYMCDLTFEAADFNQDGRADLVVGAPLGYGGAQNLAGQVRILPGSSTGPSLNGAMLIHQDTSGVPEKAEYNDSFGASLAVGDFNGDRLPDLAAGVPLEDNKYDYESRENTIVDGGVVHVFFNDGKKLSTAGSQILMETTHLDMEIRTPDWDPEPNDQHGAALAAGDFDNDGITDLAVGAPGETLNGLANVGMVTVFQGSSAGLGFHDFQTWSGSGDSTAPAAAGNRFGASLVASNFGRNYESITTELFRTVPSVLKPDDLAVGIPGQEVNGVAGGAIRIIHGFRSGLGYSALPYNSSIFLTQPGPTVLLSRMGTGGSFGTVMR